MEMQHCKGCNKDVMPNDAGSCPECNQPFESGTATQEPKKTLNLSYAKSILLDMTEDEMRETLAAKFIAPDKIFHYSFLWGDPAKTDLEREYFQKSTNFWDDILGHSPRPLTWDHAQDESMKASPVIGKSVEWGDDELGRWTISHLDRAHKYRTAVERLIKEGVVGTSSDSAPQYVEREQRGKSVYIKTWPWFASALTDQPCEHRMVGTIEFFKSLGLEFQIPEAPDKRLENDKQVREMVQKAHRIFDDVLIFGA